MKVFPVFVRALAEWWRDWLKMSLLNLGWMLCWLTVVLGPPATFAAYRIANEFAHGRSLLPREVPGHLRRFFLRSWAWFLLQIVVAAAILLNLQFYASLGTNVGSVLVGATLVLAGVWLLLQLYGLPYLMEQDRPLLLRAYRNSLLTALASPLYSLVLAIICGLLLALCVRFPFLLLLGVPMLIAVVGSTAVLERLETFGARPRADT